jgi:acyl carrier protein
MATSVTRDVTTADLSAVEATILDFIFQEVLYDKELTDRSPEASLLEAELLDSIAIMQVVAFCEQMFDVEIPEEELLPEHFESVRAIGELVERRLAAKST